MKYISLIDELGITFNDIAQIDATKIIRIQKQLKAKAVLENKSNLGELSELVSQLENQEIKEAHLFIESHPWLKKIVLGQPEELTQKAFESTYNPRPVTAFSKAFIMPFLLQTLTPTLSYLLSKGKFHLLVRLVSQERFFSEEVRQLIITFFVTRLNYANSYIAEGKLKESSLPISFVRNPEFIDSLNVYIDSLMDEVTEVNSTIIEVYNNHLKTINQEWEFAASAMAAFGRLKPPNPYQQEVYEKNAEIAKSSMSRIDFSETDEKGSYTSDGGNNVFMVVRIIVILFIVIRAIVSFSDDGPSYNDYYNETIDFQRIITANERNQNKYSTNSDSLWFVEEEIEETIIESTEEYVEEDAKETIIESAVPIISKEKTDKTIEKSIDEKYHYHKYFFYSLNNRVIRGDDTSYADGYVTPIEPFSNPYNSTFTEIQISKKKKSNTILIHNQTEKNLIVFRLKEKGDEAISIPINEKVYLEFKNKDSIIFYAGNYFMKGRFPQFLGKQGISDIYTVNNISRESKIVVLPFYFDPNNANTSKRKTTLYSTNIRLINIKSLDSLYKKAMR